MTSAQQAFKNRLVDGWVLEEERDKQTEQESHFLLSRGPPSHSNKDGVMPREAHLGKEGSWRYQRLAVGPKTIIPKCTRSQISQSQGVAGGGRN